MTLIGILAVLLGLGAVYLAIYLWGRLFIWRTSDLKTLHRYQRLPIWGPIALRKLETVYGKQLEECSIAEEAKKICKAVGKYDLPSLNLDANLKYEDLTFRERRSIVEEGDEQKLLEVIEENRRVPVNGSETLHYLAMEALRPFTEKRIHGATTVRELVPLVKEVLLMSCGCCMTKDLDRINGDETLKSLYESKLKKLILWEALKASKSNEVTSPCFQAKCEDSDINVLVAMKRNLLCLKFV